MSDRELSALYSQLEELQAKLIRYAEEARTQYDNRSEKWQESEKGIDFQTRVEKLEDAVTGFENLMSDLDETFEN